MSNRRRHAERDQSVSPFSATLIRLCESTGALGAALVDAEGETVDYAGYRNPYEIKVTAAEWRIVLGLVLAARLPGFKQILAVSIRCRARSYFVEAMPDGYAIVMELPRFAFLISRRALAQAVRELSQEAGLVLPASRSGARWARVRILSAKDDPRRPEAIWIAQAWSPLTILGRYQARDLARHEVGYLARLLSGAEVFLVREPLGYWYVDDVNAVATEPAPS